MLASHVRRAAPDTAAGVLCGQRRVPLPGAVAGGAALRPARGARGGVAAAGQRGRGVRGLAAPVAGLPGAEPGRPRPAAGAGPGAGRDEHDVLPRGGPAAAVDRGRDRVSRHGDPGRRRGADPAQRGRPRADHGGRHRRHGDQADRAAARVRLRVRQLRAVHAVRRARPPDRERRGTRRDRPAGSGHAGRRGGGDAVGPGRRAARVRPPGAAAGRGGRRRVLLGNPLRDRPAGHGPAAARHVLAHAGAAAGVRRRHRRDRAAPVPHRPGRRGDRPGRARRGHPSGKTRETTERT